ncbi:MAG: response regulator [Pseudomonadota bacterium]
MAKILVVDDSTSVRSEVSEYLRAQGISVVTAVDGIDGLVKIQEDRELRLILCDINMPNMDGLTMVEKVRESGNLIFVVMLTTEDDLSLKQRGKAAGVKGWIVKPFNGDAIINAIKKMIE